jgi:hypothetical protein
MARVSLNVIKFTEYNQAIYPFDYYVECESTTPGKLSVLESGADAANEINYNNDALIGKDGKPLFATYTAGKYVLKVLGFFKQPDATSKEFEFIMNDLNEKYVLVAKNNALVKEYYVECESTTPGKLQVVESGTADGTIVYSTVVNAYGVALYANAAAAANKYVLKVSGDKNLTIKKGNSIQGVEDKVYELRHGGTYYIVLESGRYKNVYGNDKGKVIIEVTDTLVEMAALCVE